MEDSFENQVLFNGDERYIIVGLIQKVKNGAVLCGYNKNEEDVVIKVIRKRSAYGRNFGLDSAAIERRVMQQVNELGNPFLIQLLSSWDDEDNVYLVMRWYYTSLFDQVCRKPFTVEELELPIAELVFALSRLHAAGIMHRDIKPENILMAPSGHVVLADFGLAYVRSSDDVPRWETSEDEQGFTDEFEPEKSVQSGTIVGTPAYLAPEVITLMPDSVYSRKADVWSLGMTLLEVITEMKQPYYIGESKDELMRLMMSFDPPLEWVADPELRDLLSKMLMRNPFRRWSAESLKSHPFFNGIDWDRVESGDYSPVLQPDPAKINTEEVSVYLTRPGTSRDTGADITRTPSATIEHIEYTFAYRCPDHLKLMQDRFHDTLDFSSSDEETLDNEEVEQDASSFYDESEETENEQEEQGEKDERTTNRSVGPETEKGSTGFSR